MDIRDLTGGADLILEGRVLSALADELDGRVETEYLVLVERTFAGEDQPLRTIRLPGGVLEDGRGMLLAGMPRIEPGENVLLFLSEAGDGGIRMPVGLAQGKFRILVRPDGSRILARDAAGVTLVQPETGALVRSEGRSVIDYADVIAQIEAALATKRR